MLESPMYRISSQNAQTFAPSKPSFGLANRSAFPAPEVSLQNYKKFSKWKKQSIFKKKMMVRPVIEDSDEEGNANITSSDESDCCGGYGANGSGQDNNSPHNRSFQTNNKMGDMLDGFSMGRGLYPNVGAGQKEDCGDGDMSDAGVESIVLSSDGNKESAISKQESEEAAESPASPSPTKDFKAKLESIYNNNMKCQMEEPQQATGHVE